MQKVTCKPSWTGTVNPQTKTPQPSHQGETSITATAKGALVHISYSKMIYWGNKLLGDLSFDVWLTIPTGIMHTMETMIDNLLKKRNCFLRNVSSMEPSLNVTDGSF